MLFLLLRKQGLEFKGQMLYCHESDCLLFLASPLVDGLEALTSRGLFISDIPIHDATRDIVLVGEQARAQVSTCLRPAAIDLIYEGHGLSVHRRKNAPAARIAR